MNTGKPVANDWNKHKDNKHYFKGVNYDYYRTITRICGFGF